MELKLKAFSLKPKSTPNLYNLANIKKIINKSVIADLFLIKIYSKKLKNQKTEIIFHLAAQPLVKESYLNPKETFDININGTMNIIQSLYSFTILLNSNSPLRISKNKILFSSVGGKDPYTGIIRSIYSYLKSFLLTPSFIFISEAEKVINCGPAVINLVKGIMISSTIL